MADAGEQLEQRRYDLAAETARRAMALADSAHVKGNAAIALGRALHNQWSLGLDDAFLEAVIDEAGDVRCLRPLKRLPLAMTEAAMDAVRTWKFEPATLNGEPVKIYYTLTVTFLVDRSGA